ncbi:hypothetical protein [Paraherbaspirillum soli]|uniref:Uncharacterized protein n=1 Tax=Paraherbaspirillum soli TaxID=631222 RepID=A0ABW0M621_9BURK
MARYLRMNDTPLERHFTLIVGNSLPFKVQGFGPDRKHLLIKSAFHHQVKVTPLAVNNKNIEQRLKFEAISVSAVPVLIRAYAHNGWQDMGTEALHITVLPELKLPPVDSEEGILARVLLVENIPPSSREFQSMTQAITSMQWMRHVLMNRLKFGSRHFGADNVSSITALIKARNQVEGFQSYPALTGQQSINLKDIVRIANDASDQRHAACREYVQNAIDVATGINPGSDPSPTRLYAWKTADARHPGANFVKFQTQGGQDFYTLTREFKEDPLLRNVKKP